MEIKLDQILFQMINFGVVLGALTYFLYKPVLKLLDERAKKIAAMEKTAEETARERQEVEQLKSKAKTQADKDAAKALEHAREQAAETKKELLKQAKEEAKHEKEKAVRAWEVEKRELQSAMHKEFAQAVFTVSEKVLGKAIDTKAHAELIDKGIKELSSIM